jgi:FtsP/CotA-like multicopper oxidase with cupredoxin domain
MVTLVNHLPDATSIHWHGIIGPNAMDGVAGVTQDAVKPGGTFTYEFVANEAGTYWYHSHQDTSHQIADGLIGSIVVESKDEHAATGRDYSLLVHTQPGGNAIAVNGTSNLRLDATPGETVRLRIINAVVPGFDGAPLAPVLVGAPYFVEALDGHDVNAPHQLGPERLPLGMGQRADLVFTMPDKAAVRLVGLKGNAMFPWSAPPTASVTIGDGPTSGVDTSSLPTFDLTSYGALAGDPVLDAAQYDVTRDIVLGGGPMFRNGTFDFSDTFDGMASPYVAPIRVREGQLVRLHIVNNSPKFHPIHVHGHVFSVLSKNGHRLTGAPIHLDAILVAPGETWDVAFKADNPGIWMLHCHVLAHATAGMSMTINYEGIYTPFAMGTQSGNIPE